MIHGNLGTQTVSSPEQVKDFLISQVGLYGEDDLCTQTR
jgi:hypothetical protein